MDKNRTKELIFSLRVILLGIFLWTIKVITDFFHLNLFYVEIISLLLILSGLFIIRRIFPFSYTLRSSIYAWLILIINILLIFKTNNRFYTFIDNFKFFFMTILFFLTSKIMEKSLRYFGEWKLSRKWKDFAIISFFGLTTPAYILTTLYTYNAITFQKVNLSTQVIMLTLPAVLTLSFFIGYYIWYMIKSFKYLSSIEKNNKPKKHVAKNKV